MAAAGMMLRNQHLVGGGQRRVEMPSHCRPVFEEGAALIFTRWTALQLGVANEWGGARSSHKAQELLGDVIGWFYSTKGAGAEAPPAEQRLLPSWPQLPAALQTTRCAICKTCWMKRCSWILTSRRRTTARTRYGGVACHTSTMAAQLPPVPRCILSSAGGAPAGQHAQPSGGGRLLLRATDEGGSRGGFPGGCSQPAGTQRVVGGG